MYGEPDVTFRPTARQLLPQFVIVALGFVVAGFVGDKTLVTVCLLALGLVLLIWRRYGTIVRTDGLVVLGFANRFIDWQDVRDIVSHEQFGGRGLIVVERSGRRTLLKAPRDARFGHDPEYDRKRDIVLTAWATR